MEALDLTTTEFEAIQVHCVRFAGSTKVFESEEGARDWMTKNHPNLGYSRSTPSAIKAYTDSGVRFFSIGPEVEVYDVAEERRRLRQCALNKLTPEEKEALGLT